VPVEKGEKKQEVRASASAPTVDDDDDDDDDDDVFQPPHDDDSMPNERSRTQSANETLEVSWDNASLELGEAAAQNAPGEMQGLPPPRRPLVRPNLQPPRGEWPRVLHLNPDASARVQVRVAPSSTSESIAELSPGDEVLALSESGDWLRVRIGSDVHRYTPDHVGHSAVDMWVPKAVRGDGEENHSLFLLGRAPINESMDAAWSSVVRADDDDGAGDDAGEDQSTIVSFHVIHPALF
jgi:hypothetical protein